MKVRTPMRRSKWIFRMSCPEEGDWDEAEVRAKAAEEGERLTEEAQPGRTEEA